MIFKNKKKLNKKNSKIFLNKLINKENIKFYRVDFDQVDFERGWFLIVYLYIYIICSNFLTLKVLKGVYNSKLCTKREN